MKAYRKIIATIILVLLICPINLFAESLRGVIGFSARWGVGWIDLQSFTNFRTGEQLRIKVGGTAKKVIVRFLKKGVSPEFPEGIEDGPFKVPANRILIITLKHDHYRIAQVSVHGGPNPWGEFPLGEDNGPASIGGIERLAAINGSQAAGEKE